MSLHPRRALVALACAFALTVVVAPLVARSAPAPASAAGQADQMDMRPYVRLAITGLIEEFKDSVIKNGDVIDVGTLVRKTRGEYSIGSGTIITPDGLIVTNYHVLEALLEPSFDYDNTDKILTRYTASRMLVGMVDAKDPLAPVVDRYVADDVAWLESRDVALVRIDTDARTGEPVVKHDFPYAQVGNPYAIPVLATLTVFGYPAKGGRSINPSMGPFQGFTFDVSNAIDGSIKTSAQIAGGNSGGAALYNGRLIAIPTRVSSKADKGSDFGYLHPITWAAQLFAYAALKYGMVVPKIDPAWLGSTYNTSPAKTMSYAGITIVSGQSRMPVGAATVIVHRADRTLEQIKDLYNANDEIATVRAVQRRLKEGMTEAQVAESMKLKPQEVRAYKDMKVNMASLSADVQAYDRGEFFYDVSNSNKDGWVFMEFPRGREMGVAVIKDGFKDFIGTVKPVTTLEADLGKIQILMR